MQRKTIAAVFDAFPQKLRQLHGSLSRAENGGRKYLHAVLPVALGVVQRRAGALQQAQIGGAVVRGKGTSARQRTEKFTAVKGLLCAEGLLHSTEIALDSAQCAAAQDDPEFIAVQPKNCAPRRSERLQFLADDTDDLIPKQPIVQAVDAFKAVDAEQQHAHTFAGLGVQQAAHLVLKFEFVKYARQVVHFVLFSQVGDDTRKQYGFAARVALQVPAAAHPNPFAVAVTGAVFDTMAVGTAVRDFLVGFQKRLLVVGMHLRTPDGRRVGNDAAGQVKLVHHGLGITKNAGFHVADVDIVVGTLHQSVQQINRIIGEVHAGAALWGMQQRVLGVGDVETPLFFVELFIHVA